MSTPRLFIITIGVLLISVLRDFIGATVFWASPLLSSALMRLFDLIYFGYFGYAVLAFCTHAAFTRFQRVVFSLAGLFVLISLLQTQDLSAFIRSSREILLPVAFLITGAMIGRDRKFRNGRNQVALMVLYGTLLVSLLIGIIQMATIHDFRDYWFYEYMVKNNIYVDESVSFIRNDIARGTGLGMSPFSLGYFGLGLTMLVFMDYQLYPARTQVRNAGLKLIAFLAAGIGACLVSNSRLALSCILLLTITWKSRLSPKIMIPVGALAVFLFGSALVDRLQDASLSGRFVQWGDAVLNGVTSRPFGSAIASGPAGVWFDSYILNFLTSFGILALLAVLVFIASFAHKFFSRTYVFVLMLVILLQVAVQALEYCPFMQLSLLSLGLYFGHTRKDALAVEPA